MINSGHCSTGSGSNQGKDRARQLTAGTQPFHAIGFRRRGSGLEYSVFVNQSFC